MEENQKGEQIMVNKLRYDLYYNDEINEYAGELYSKGLHDGATRKRRQTQKQVFAKINPKPEYQEALYYRFYLGAFLKAKWIKKGGEK
jgi:hypothetical protein